MTGITHKARGRFPILGILAIGLLALLPACAGLAPDPRSMSFPPVEIIEPEIEVLTLDNGMTLYLLPDRELPLIRISALIRAGTLYTPDQVDVARFAGSQMRGGGVGDTPPDELDEALGFGAIILYGGIGSDAASAGLNTLTRTFPEALGYFADLLRHPRYDADRLNTAKDAALESIRRKNDNPGGIARREFAKLIYGTDHPLSHDASAADIRAVQRQDLVDYHRQQIRPDRVMLGITGDFEREAMLKAIRDAFGDWRAEVVPLPDPVKLPTREVRRVAFSHKPITQVSVRIGHLSIQRDDPDYYALQLANNILGGGGFRSRLFNTVRTRHGLAYSVGSGLRAGQGDRGSFLMGVKTRSDQVSQALTLMFDEVDRLRTEPVPEDELNAAKEAFLNGFVFKSVNVNQVLSRRMHLDYYGMPLDELQRLKENTMAVTPADIMRVARAHLEPERMSIFAVGDRDVLTRALAPFGTPVEVHLDGADDADDADAVETAP